MPGRASCARRSTGLRRSARAGSARFTRFLRWLPPIWCSCAATSPADSDEALHELERRLGDFPPAAVDRERVAAIRHLLDLGHGLVSPLPLVGGVSDRPGNGVVLLSVEDQQR